MISVIVYGRNDERGYGMHKRVAISLNALASVIDEGTAEILFVDYNTPDHLPTLPELIRDTLTDAARRRTRVLRVRPEHHRPYLDLTPLPVLEPIARNVALRRSRPQNHWILSTNTDSIIVPKGSGSLISAVKELRSGHYVLPRYELPERVWESFDRLDAKGTIEAAARWGRMARLDEAVRGEGSVLFDSPGDFQLVTRSDLFKLDGFDEEMLQGWHVDHNLARRLELALGPPTSLADKLALYHCGHARQATATHSHDRRENDVGRFVSRISSPEIAHQRHQWGCPDANIETIDLTRPAAAALQTAIEAAMAPLAAAPLASAYNKLSFDNFWYDAGHVASHLLDLLSTYPKDAVIAFAGCRRDLLKALLGGLSALGFVNRVLVPDELAERLGAKAVPQIQPAPLEAVTEAADVLLFEFGLVRDEGGAAREPTLAVEPTEAERDVLERVAEAFRAVVALERSALAFGDPGRLLVAVNAVHTRYDAMVAGVLAHAPSPFTTRLRYGRALPASTSTGAPVEREERPAPGAVADLAAARETLRLLAGDASTLESHRLEIAANAGMVGQLLQSGRLDGQLGASKPVLAARLAAIAKPAPELEAIAVQPAATAAGACTGPSGTATLACWDDPAWLAQARRVSTAGPRGSILRNGWVWERAQILSAVARLTASRKGVRALVVAEHPDILVCALADDLGPIDVGDIRRIAGDDMPLLRKPSDFAGGGFLGKDAIRIVDLSRPLEGRYDIIVLPHSALFRSTVPGAAPILAKLRPHLADGGTMMIGGEVAVLGRGRLMRPLFVQDGEDALARALADAGGLTLQGDARFVIHRGDAALVGTVEELDDGRPVIGLRREDEIYWPAVWSLTSSGAPAENMQERLTAELTSLVIGDITPVLSLTERARRDGRTIIGLSGHGAGHVFFGPYVTLPPGSFKAVIEIAGAGTAGDAGRLTGEVCVGSDIVVQRDSNTNWARSGHRQTLELPFVLNGADEGAAQPCEVRLWTEGKAEVRVASVRLDAQS